MSQVIPSINIRTFSFNLLISDTLSEAGPFEPVTAPLPVIPAFCAAALLLTDNKFADIGKNYHICSRNKRYFADKRKWIT